jgi:hypothetical protein
MQLVCFKPGDKSTFSVDIEGTKTVEQLKDEIKNKRPSTLANVDSVDLTLFQVKVDIPVNVNQYRQILQDMSRSDYEFLQKEELIAACMVSRYFQADSGETIEVLVEIGELIKSTACATVPGHWPYG